MSRPIGIIFDLDGTLVDTLKDIAAALNHTIAPERIGPLTIEDVGRYVGDGLSTLIARSINDDDPERIARLVLRFRAYYADHLLIHSRLYPGWNDTFDEIAARNVPCAVLSNKPDDFTRTICEKLLGYQPVIYAEGQRENLPIKPDPTRSLAIARILGVQPDRMIFVGDSEVDVQTALRAGMTPIGVSWGFRSREIIERAGAGRIIENPAELLPIIDELLPKDG